MPHMSTQPAASQDGMQQGAARCMQLRPRQMQHLCNNDVAEKQTSEANDAGLPQCIENNGVEDAVEFAVCSCIKIVSQ
jgi:hypothetical protein